MEQHDVEPYYDGGLFKRGHSQEVDRAIVGVLQALGDPGQTFDEPEFRARWADFVRATVEDFQNISAYNLTNLEMRLNARELRRENLFVTRLVAELLPNSWESTCFLGHSYREVGLHALAIDCYTRAFELAVKEIESKERSATDPLWLDASDYLCYRAECESELGQNEDAIVSLIRALSIVKEAYAMEFKATRIHELLSAVLEAMGLTELVAHYKS